LNRSRTFAGKAHDQALKQRAVESKRLSLSVALPAPRLWASDSIARLLQKTNSINEDNKLVRLLAVANVYAKYFRKSFGVLLSKPGNTFAKFLLPR
jgi:hypothetical protein